MAAGEASTAKPRQEKQYDYLLKFLLVGDSDVGKQEILSGLEDGAAESPFCSGSGTILQSVCRCHRPLFDICNKTLYKNVKKFAGHSRK